jgi:hypothetical protein
MNIEDEIRFARMYVAGAKRYLEEKKDVMAYQELLWAEETLQKIASEMKKAL